LVNHIQKYKPWIELYLVNWDFWWIKIFGYGFRILRRNDGKWCNAFLYPGFKI